MLYKDGLPAEWQRVERILAVRLDNIGDAIMLGPALRGLKEALPEAEITLLASPAGSQIAPLLPWVKDVYTWRAVWQDISGDLGQDAGREIELVETLRRGAYDAAVIFTSFSQSPYPPAYACFLAGIPIRVGQSKEFGGSLLTQWVKPPEDSGHQVDRNLHLVEAIGFPVTRRDLELVVPDVIQAAGDCVLLQAGLDPAQPFILLAPGASCTARRYDPMRFAAAARMLAQGSGLPLVLVGSPREAETLKPVLEAVDEGAIHSLIGQTSITELAAIVRRSSLMIANNSAGLHLADAFRRPMVILYSGTEYFSQWEPHSSPARLLRREVDCSPCYRFNCPYQMECLDIPPEEVAQAGMELLQAAG